jgi:uncharacterized protein (TIGR02285 family)
VHPRRPFRRAHAARRALLRAACWLGLGLAGAGSSAAAAERELIWYRIDLPPIYIFEGPYRDKELQKISDAAILAALQAKGYQVTYRNANLERILHGLRNHERACTTSMVTSAELAKELVFSIPHSISLPGAAIVLKSRLAEFQPHLDAKGRLSLDAALRSALRLGIAAGRSYSGAIDEALQRNTQRPNVFRRKGEDISAGLLRMLTTRRIDYTLQFPWEASYVARTLGLPETQQIVSLPIQGMPDYVTAGGASPRNDRGRRGVAIMNEAILGMRDTPQNHELKEFWLDENSRQLYREHWKAFRSQQPKP